MNAFRPRPRNASSQPRGGGRRSSRSFFFCGSWAMPTMKNSSGVVPVFSNVFRLFNWRGTASPVLIDALSAPTVTLPAPAST